MRPQTGVDNNTVCTHALANLIGLVGRLGGLRAFHFGPCLFSSYTWGKSRACASGSHARRNRLLWNGLHHGQSSAAVTTAGTKSVRRSRLLFALDLTSGRWQLDSGHVGVCLHHPALVVLPEELALVLVARHLPERRSRGVVVFGCVRVRAKVQC